MSTLRRIGLAVAALAWMGLSVAVWWYVIHAYLDYRASKDPYGRPALEAAMSEKCSNAAPGAVPVLRVPPVYPARAQAAGVEGFVVVEFTIHADGTTADVTILDSDPSGTFDRAAVAAIERWRYCPDDAVRGEGVQSRVRIPFEMQE